MVKLGRELIKEIIPLFLNSITKMLIRQLKSIILKIEILYKPIYPKTAINHRGHRSGLRSKAFENKHLRKKLRPSAYSLKPL